MKVVLQKLFKGEYLGFDEAKKSLLEIGKGNIIK